MASTSLSDLHSDFRLLCESVEAFQPRSLLYRPPIIDANEEYGEQDLPGFKKFKGTVENELRWVDQLVASERPPAGVPSSNAPFLMAVWKEVLAARQPLVALSRPVSNKVSVRDGVKIDVISEGGRRWTKVNTIKASRLLLEFREQDSYINSDYDSDSSSASHPLADHANLPFSPVSSVTRQCYQLSQAANEQLLRTGDAPKITYRFTRMQPGEEGDVRIQRTYACLREMGIHLEFGESTQKLLVTPDVNCRNPSPLLPTVKLNLDLSLLIALVSDISHAVLPISFEAADERFKPLPRAWKRPSKEGEDDLGAEEHFRALASQVKEEMRAALVDDLKERLGLAIRAENTDSVPKVELWTTVEAKERCRVIVDKIGGPEEKRRCQRMFEEGEDDFWKGSRHAADPGILSDLQVKVFEQDSPPPELAPADPTSFCRALQDTCDILVNLGSDMIQSIPLRSLPHVTDKDEPRRIPSKHKAKQAESPKIHIPTAHTSRSLLEGARRGMTTVTANRMSVKQAVRAIGRLEGLDNVHDNRAQIWVVEPKTLSEQKRNDLTDEEAGRAGNPSARYTTAAVWVVEPRSLAEAMRTA